MPLPAGMVHSMKKAIVMGSVVLDITPVLSAQTQQPIERIFSQGKVTDLASVAFYLGGCVGNTGVALHKLGVPTRLYCKVGDDLAGSVVETLLQRQDVPAEMQTESEHPTSVGIALTPPGLDKVSLFLRGASQQTLAMDALRVDLTQSDLLHFGYPTSMRTMFEHNGDELLRFLRYAKNTGVTCSLDTSLPPLNSEAGQTDWRPILERVLPLTDLFVPSYEESVFMLHRERYVEQNRALNGANFVESVTDEDARRIADEFLAMGAKIVLIKMGAKGLYLRTAEPGRLEDMGRAVPQIDEWALRELWQAPLYVERIVSATGAGDVAIAGFLAAFLAGKGPQEALQAANIAASLCLQSSDSSGKLLPLEAMMQRDGKEDQPVEYLPLPKDTWSVSSLNGLFIGKRDGCPSVS